MSAKIFTMKDSETESLGAFAQPLLAKQVPYTAPRDIKRLPTTPFSLILRKEYFDH
jgi:hypothetical protein